MTTLFSPSLLLISTGPIGDIASDSAIIHTIDDISDNTIETRKCGYKISNYHDIILLNNTLLIMIYNIPKI